MPTPKDFGYDPNKLTQEQLDSIQKAIDGGNVFTDKDQDQPPPTDSTTPTG